MAENVTLGQTVRVEVVFLDTNDNPVDPSEILIRLTDENDEDLDVDFDVEQEDTGIFYVNWTPVSLGLFLFEFTGIFPGDDDVVAVHAFVVGIPDGIPQLLQDQEIIFASEIEPLFLDPEEFLPQYPQSSRVEIAELINRYSIEVQRITGSSNPSILALDYIRASVLCFLSRIYDFSMGEGSSLTLGDLNISNQSFQRSSVDRSNAANWCELAAVLRDDLLRSSANMKAVVKGTKFKNPMPKRHLKAPYGERR